LNYIIKVNFMSTYYSWAAEQMHDLYLRNKIMASRGYEALFFMISHIFNHNRLPGINFIGEVNAFLHSQAEEIGELTKT